MNAREIWIRVLAALVGGPIILFMVYRSPAAFVLILNVIIGFSVWEFYSLTETQGNAPHKISGTVITLFFTWFLGIFQGRFVLPALAVFVLFILLEALFRKKLSNIANIAITLFGFLYISLFNAFIFLRILPEGRWIVICLFISIWICDATAYFFGSRFGRHLLFKRVSPAKTWEGGIAGLVGALITALLLFPRIEGYSWIDGLVIGLIISIAGPMSDLVESLFKREAGIKDSSSLIPGHGGMLDRFDSPLFIGPLVLFYILLSHSF